MQRWKNGSGYIFLERPDAQEEVSHLFEGQGYERVSCNDLYNFQTAEHWNVIGPKVQRGALRCIERPQISNKRNNIHRHPCLIISYNLFTDLEQNAKFASIYAQSIHLPFWAAPSPHIAMTKPAHLLHGFPKSIAL
jgi:hypothetical protein